MRINSLVEAAELEKEVAMLSPEESHHLARVLRARPGQEITLFDGRGGVAEALIESVSKSVVEARIAKRWSVPKPSVEIDLIQAVPKPDRWELVLQKAVELGVANILPVLTKHTEFKPNSRKQERWEKIVLNAAQQCEVRWLPHLAPLAGFDEILPDLAGYDLVLVGSLYEEARPFREVSFQNIGKAALLIGPEGDFTREEVDSVVAAGAVPVSFGERILRTETAAIFGLSVLAYELL
jgi:16S rRNA (uracil1498-N3)-methyltransferase